MRITYIAAGAAGSYCGACARDVGLARGLIRGGHDVVLCPLYTPLRLDGPDPSVRRIFYGGINVYLQQRLRLFRRTPRCLDRLLDRPGLLRLASRFAIRTRPEELGEMTVSVLRGADGFQGKEVEKLLGFLAEGLRPDVVNLSNSLLSGLAPAVKERLGAAVVCTLQGEEDFVGRLPERHREQATALVRGYARHVDLFVAPYPAYADEMSAFLDVPRERIAVIGPGVDVASYGVPGERTAGEFRIGFLSRITPSKGIDLLCEAFRLLAGEAGGPTAVLAVAGQLSKADAKSWAGLRSRLDAAGLADRLDYAGEVDFAGKVSFLGRCHAFCVPARAPQRACIAWVEALVAGVPLVVPDVPGLREIADTTGAALVVPPDDAAALAEALGRLRADAALHARLARAARDGAEEHFTLDAMVERTLEAYAQVVPAGGSA